MLHPIATSSQKLSRVLLPPPFFSFSKVIFIILEPVFGSHLNWTFFMNTHWLCSHFFGILIAVKKSLYLRYCSVKPLALKLNYQIVRKTLIHSVLIWHLCTLSNCTICFAIWFGIHKRDSKRKIFDALTCFLWLWFLLLFFGLFSFLGLGFVHFSFITPFCQSLLL